MHKFKDLAKVCKEDISRFEDSFFHMLDINGAIPSYSVGFHFSLDPEGEPSDGETEKALDIFETFSPAVLYAGNQRLQYRLAEMGRSSVLMPLGLKMVDSL